MGLVFETKIRSRTTFLSVLLKSVLPTLILLSYVRPDAWAFAFRPIFASKTALSATPNATPTDAELNTGDVVNKIAVTGATGRTGVLVVQELLDRGVDVVAMVRDLSKAKEKFPNPSSRLAILQCDLTSEQEICSAVEDCDGVIWCATGFSDSPEAAIVDKVKKMLGMALAPQRSIDAVGIPALAKAFSSKERIDVNGKAVPKVIMLSSAGVTRPSWDETKKKRFAGCADIPIVRLNPFGILDVKAESEERLRQSGVDYCILRPGGLNDKWPEGSRPLFSQGDIAVGRINRKDVACILVDTLTRPESTGKTFEVITLCGYPPAKDIGTALAKLKPDREGIPSDDVLAATYAIMQQVLPGETQDAAALAMGQTYEQLDRDQVGRLGKRGEENAEAAAPKPTS